MKHLMLLSLLLVALLVMASAMPADDEESAAKKESKEEESREKTDKDNDENKYSDEDSDDKMDNDKNYNSDNDVDSDKDDERVKDDDIDKDDDSYKDDDDDDDEKEHKEKDNKKDKDKDDDNEKDDEETSHNKHTSPIANFAVKLFKSMSHHKAKSFFMSPFSVWHTLHLAYHGAAGETKKQLMNALYNGKKEQDYKEIGADLSHLHKVMNVMNKVYITKGSELKKSTLKNILKDVKPDKKSFEGSSDEALTELEDYILPVDFSATDDVMNTINKDVKDATNDAIPEIIGKDDIDSDTKMVLVNAIHFKGDWKTKFVKDATKKKDFHYYEGEENKTEKVDMMTIFDERFNFATSKTLGCSIVELPYITSEKNESKVSMYVFLPDEGNKVQDFMDKITPEHLLNKLPELKMKTVHIELPKFKMEVKLEGDLREGIADQGITDIFNEKKADFSEFFNKKMPGLYAGKIVHKALIEIDEEGTTAAGATALQLGTRSASFSERFVCNRPFVFMIVDKEYNNPIFTGVFRNPNDVQPVERND